MSPIIWQFYDLDAYGYFLEPNTIKDAQHTDKFHTARIYSAYTWAPSAPWSPAMPGSPGSPWNKEKGKTKNYTAKSSIFLNHRLDNLCENTWANVQSFATPNMNLDLQYPPTVLGVPLGLSFQYDPKEYDVLLSSYLLIINDYFSCVKVNVGISTFPWVCISWLLLEWNCSVLYFVGRRNSNGYLRKQGCNLCSHLYAWCL